MAMTGELVMKSSSLGEQGLPIDDKVQDTSTMFPENRFIKLNHLYAAQAKPFLDSKISKWCW